MKRFDYSHGHGGKPVEAPDIDAFLAEVMALCRKHNMWIGHEDSQGGFIVHRGFDEKGADWIQSAQIG